MADNSEFDFVVIGGGTAGCAVSHQLAEANIGTIAVLEAGGGDTSPFVKAPMALMQLMGSKCDWRMKSTPQENACNRQVSVPRGKLIGGSGSINSMVWFRGRMDDYDAWDLPDWSAKNVEPIFEKVEEHTTPQRLPDPHPMAEAFGKVLNGNGFAPPTPEYESAGVFYTNMRNGRRWSAADAFLRPALRTGRVRVITNAEVDKIAFEANKAKSVHLADGRIIYARKGVILSAGSIGSPAILMRSGIGPAEHLKSLGIDVIKHSHGIGKNLHDHPAVGLHHAGKNSGYGLTLNQMPSWMMAPFRYFFAGKGPFTSNIVEAGAFFRAMPGADKPDCQVHFIPYMMGWKGRTLVPGSGYFADVCVSRPKSRGRLTLATNNPRSMPDIDLGLLTEPDDQTVLREGFKRLRQLMKQADFADRHAKEAYPGEDVSTDDEIEGYIKNRCGTSYHPVGTICMGADQGSPLTSKLSLRGVRGLWVADASVMPSITSANTNAPSMMIGYRAGKNIAEGLKNG